MKKLIVLSIVLSALLSADNISDVIITEESSVDGSGSTITNESYVYQAQTNISGSSDVSSLNISENNLISNTEIDGSTVEQGLTAIQDAEVDDLNLESDNSISNTSITNSYATQSQLLVKDASFTNSSIGASNEIYNSSVEESEVHQARVRIGGGYSVDRLEMDEKNSIYDSSITDNSLLAQGGFDVCSEATVEWCD